MLDLVQLCDTSPALPGDLVRIGVHVFTVLRVESVTGRLYMQSLMEGVSTDTAPQTCWINGSDVRFVHRTRNSYDALRRHIHPDLSGRYRMRDMSELTLTIDNPVIRSMCAKGVALTLSPQSSDPECMLWTVDVDQGGQCVVSSLQGASIPTSDYHFDMTASGSAPGGRVQLSLSFKGVPYHPDDRPAQIAFRLFAWHDGADVPACATGVLHPLMPCTPVATCTSAAGAGSSARGS